MKINKRNLLTVILSAICAVLLACSVCMLSGLSARAQTNGNLTSANNVIIKELTIDNYDSTENAVFDYYNLQDLYSALTGGAGNTLQAVANTVLGSDVSYGLTTTAASGVQPTIPKYVSAYDLYTLNGNKNILVDFGGQTWTVTFLTTDTSGDVIATLWLADAYKDETGNYVRSQYSWYDKTTNANVVANATNYVPGMYSSSLIRVKTLNGGDVNGGATKYAWGTLATDTTATLSQTVSASDRLASPWAKFTLNNSALNGTEKENQSLVPYLDTPSQIKYTYYEDFHYHYYTLGKNSQDFYFPNEAINIDLTGAITGTKGAYTIRTSSNVGYTAWHNATTAIYPYVDYTAGVGYNDWANDYLWLPSWSETGATTIGTVYGMPGIWETSKSTRTVANQTGQNLFMTGAATTPIAWNSSNQNSINAAEYIWLRSGYSTDTVKAVYLTSGVGAWGHAVTARSLGVRPAIHLNLTKADDACHITTPKDVETSYTGTDWAGLTQFLSLNVSWYNEKYVDLNFATSMINAGSYTVTASLSSLATAVGLTWGDNGNTTAAKTFTFEIKKKTINYTLSPPSVTYDGTTAGTVSVPTLTGVLPQDTGQTTGPNVVIYYKSTDSYGYGTGSDDDSGTKLGSLTAPTMAGQYIATAVDLNDSTSNYSLSGSPVNFEIKPKALTAIGIGTSSKKYDGTAQTFQLTGSFDANYMNIVRTGYTLDSSNNYSDGVAWDPANNRITATNVGTYDFSFELKDIRNTCWSPYPSSGTAYDVVAKPVSLEITPFDLSSNISLDPSQTSGNTGTQWGLGEQGQIVLQVSALGSDSVTLYIEYYSSSDSSSIYRAGVNDSTLTLDTSQILTVDSYVLRARLQTTSDSNYSADNANYTISGEYWTYNFDIGAGAANVKINWTYDLNGIPTPLFDASGNQTKLEYCGQTYVLAAKVDSSTSYATLDTSAHTGYTNGLYTVRKDGNACDMKAVGTYITRVALVVDSDHEFPTAQRFNASDGTHGWVEIEWTISKCELDFTNAKWEYSYDKTTWYDFDTDGDPEYDAGGIYIRINETYLKGLGLDSSNPDSVEIAYSVDLFNGSGPLWALLTKGNGYTAYAELTVLDDNYTSVTGTNVQTVQKQFDVTAQKITVTWSSTGLSFQTIDGTSDTYGISKAVDKNGNDCSSLFDYTFTFEDSSGATYGPMTLADAQTFFAANASNTNTYKGTVTAVLNNSADYEFNGAYSHDFTVGKSLPTITVDIEKSGSQYKDVTFVYSAEYNGTPFAQHMNVSVYAYNDYYAGNAALITKLGSEASAIQEFLNTQDAGKYVIESIAVAGSPAANYVIRNDVFEFEIAKREIVAPTVVNADQIVYKASEYSILDYLSGYEPSLMELDAQHSDTSGKTAKDYIVTINLLDPKNYIFVYATSTVAPAKVQLRAVVTDDEVSSTTTIGADGSYADVGWTIQKFVITDSMFNSATGELSLPSQFNDIIANEMLQVGYTYYADKTSSEPVTELKPGETYYVVASLGGESASNFVFENPSQMSDTTSQRVTFKPPQSGFNAVMGKIADFVKGTWLGLPIWAWLLIGLALLILLIIIIAVACKRRKSKEEKQAIKERKEEEKARREEERQLQREKLEAERELAKAKQEAELEKIRAQAQMAAGVGMASMAMQQPQQPQQAQPVQQPVQQAQQPQPMPQPQVPYYGQPSGEMAMILARIEGEIAQLRAEQHASHGYSAPAPASAPVYGPQPGNNDASAIMLAKMEAEFAKIQAKQEASQEVNAAKMELEFFKLHGIPMNYASLYSYNQLAQQSGKPVIDMPNRPQGNYSTEEVGAIMAAMMRNMGISPVGSQNSTVAELPQVTEESKNSASASYPPDAVITTTTTVDTTKKGADSKTVQSSQLNDGRLFDIDGFYDNFESK